MVENPVGWTSSSTNGLLASAPNVELVANAAINQHPQLRPVVIGHLTSPKTQTTSAETTGSRKIRLGEARQFDGQLVQPIFRIVGGAKIDERAL